MTCVTRQLLILVTFFLLISGKSFLNYIQAPPHQMCFGFFFSIWFSFRNIHKSQSTRFTGPQTLAGDCCRELNSTHSWQPFSNREPFASARKSLTTKLRCLQQLSYAPDDQLLVMSNHLLRCFGEWQVQADLKIVQNKQQRDITSEKMLNDNTQKIN